jgi:hypothetical protein
MRQTFVLVTAGGGPRNMECGCSEAVEKGVWNFESTIELRGIRAAREFQTPFSTRC